MLRFRGEGGRAFLCSLAAAMVSAVGPLRAQEHPIHFAVRAPRNTPTVRPGDTLTVRVDGTIPVGWHLYSITQPPGGPVATTVDVGPSSLVRLRAAVKAPVPIPAPDPNFGIESEWYEDSVAFRIPLRVSHDATPGKREIAVRIGYQTCTARYCLPPTEDTVRLAVRVEGAPLAAVVDPKLEPDIKPAAAAIAPVVAATTVMTPPQSRQGSESFALFLWLAATMGALSLLTPCVFPMVPITISYFSGGTQASRGQAVRDALLYAGGIIVAFTGIGVGLSGVMGVAGMNRFAASPLLNLAIAALFVVFALSLFDILNVALPQRLLMTLDRASSGSHFGRVTTSLLMGVTFAVTTFTCTAPFVGTLLVSATQGNWRWPAAGLLVFSSVFALPFLVLALVPRALGQLPRSGEWLSTMKGGLAFIELAAALKFVSNADLVQGWGIFTRQTVVALWTILGVALTAYLVGARFRGRTLARGGRWYRVASLAALAATVFVATGLTGGRLGELESFLPPAGRNANGVAARNELDWMLDDFDGSLRKAREQGKLVLIDFTGYTCTNCRWMEANMFPRPDVVRELDQYVRVRLFTDGRGDVYKKQQALEREKFQTVALPLYAIVDSLGAPRAMFLGMTRDTREFVQFLAGARGARP
jgi:thiol:disulfide interchange protein DsbD